MKMLGEIVGGINKGKDMKRSLLKAALAQYESNAITARANLELYLIHPSAVAEHPDIVCEVAKLVQQITESEENIRTLEDMLKPIGAEQ
jgi:hypothetical protein